MSTSPSDPRPSPRGFVYLLQAQDPSDPIKIGFTTRRAADRARAAQTYCSTPVRVLAEAPGTLDDERRLHAHFAASRVRGEWFAATEELRDLAVFLAEGGMLESFLGPP